MDKNSPTQKRFGAYNVLKMLGKGAFGAVSVGKNVETGEKVALKIVDMSKWSDKSKARKSNLLKREIQMFHLLHHPNVIRFISSFKEGHHVVLVMEFGEGGDLDQYLRSQHGGFLSQKNTRKLFRQILSGVDYLHQNHIIHRDLKPKNIILDAKHKVPKIIDFGFTNIFTEGNLMQSVLGSPHFSAPELLVSKEYDGRGVDIWSLGVMLFKCLTGVLPFDEKTNKKLMEKIVSGIYDCNGLPLTSRNLIKRMLTVDMNKRAKMPEILNHSWLTEGFDVPPNNFTFSREEPILDINESIFQMLSKYGFDQNEENRNLIKKEGSSAVKNIYCLILEAYYRDTQQKYIEEAKKRKVSLEERCISKCGSPAQPVTYSQTSPAIHSYIETEKKSLTVKMKQLLSPKIFSKMKKFELGERSPKFLNANVNE